MACELTTTVRWQRSETDSTHEAGLTFQAGMTRVAIERGYGLPVVLSEPVPADRPFAAVVRMADARVEAPGWLSLLVALTLAAPHRLEAELARYHDWLELLKETVPTVGVSLRGGIWARVAHIECDEEAADEGSDAVSERTDADADADEGGSAIALEDEDEDEDEDGDEGDCRPVPQPLPPVDPERPPRLQVEWDPAARRVSFRAEGGAVVQDVVLPAEALGPGALRLLVQANFGTWAVCAAAGWSPERHAECPRWLRRAVRQLVLLWHRAGGGSRPSSGGGPGPAGAPVDLLWVALAYAFADAS